MDNRIRDAGYLAKTDHLRRMMERSKGRKPTRRVTALDWASSVGSWLWWGGLGLQLFWHLVLAAELLGDRPSPDGMRDPDDQGMAAWLLTLAKPAAAFLPSADVLSKWSITASILSVWWNPYFVQVNRGFTRHLLGLTQWYSFQGLIVFFRLVFRVFAHAQIRDGQSANAQLASHLVMAGLIGLVWRLRISPHVGICAKCALDLHQGQEFHQGGHDSALRLRSISVAQTGEGKGEAKDTRP